MASTVLKRPSRPSQTYPDIPGAVFPLGDVTVTPAAADMLASLDVDVSRVLTPHARFLTAAPDDWKRVSRVGLHTRGRILSSQHVRALNGGSHTFALLTDLTAGTTHVYANGTRPLEAFLPPPELSDATVLSLDERAGTLNAQIADLRDTLPVRECADADAAVRAVEAEYDSTLTEVAGNRLPVAQRERAETALSTARDRQNVLRQRLDAMQAHIHKLGVELDAVETERRETITFLHRQRVSREQRLDDMIALHEAGVHPLNEAFDGLVTMLRQAQTRIDRLRDVGATPNTQFFADFGDYLQALGRGETPNTPGPLRMWE